MRSQEQVILLINKALRSKVKASWSQMSFCVFPPHIRDVVAHRYVLVVLLKINTWRCGLQSFDVTWADTTVWTRNHCIELPGTNFFSSVGGFQKYFSTFFWLQFSLKRKSACERGDSCRQTGLGKRANRLFEPTHFSNRVFLLGNQ